MNCMNNECDRTTIAFFLHRYAFTLNIIIFCLFVCVLWVDSVIAPQHLCHPNDYFICYSIL